MKEFLAIWFTGAGCWKGTRSIPDNRLLRVQVVWGGIRLNPVGTAQFRTDWLRCRNQAARMNLSTRRWRSSAWPDSWLADEADSCELLALVWTTSVIIWMLFVISVVVAVKCGYCITSFYSFGKHCSGVHQTKTFVIDCHINERIKNERIKN